MRDLLSSEDFLAEPDVLNDEDPHILMPVVCLIGVTAAAVGLIMLFAMAVPS